MEQFKDFMLNVWREACRNIEITEFVATIAEILMHQMPLKRLVVRRIDGEKYHIETLAASSASGSEKFVSDHAEWGIDKIKQLLDWCYQGKVKLHKAGDKTDHISFNAVPKFVQGDVLIGPLVSEHKIFGLLLLEGIQSHSFTAEHERICLALLEPFAVALENDHRLSELKALREAAEADKRSLLARLGREDLSEMIIGVNGGLRSVMERVRLVARSDVPVLIFGETGSGKEVIARAIHNRSMRASGPFMRVNCGAIPPGLIDSELFGHEKGSFTGATSTHRGWFERANGGTLFLDEIGELPQDAQVRLLRVLQDGSFERVGGERPITVDVRIIAATHRDLAARVQDGKFREDLWYRIAVFPIVLPPLRERQEDIPALAEHYARRAAIRFGLKLQLPTPGDISLLAAYHWQGNVREFASVIDRAAILGDGERLEVAKALGVVTDVVALPKVASSSPGAAGVNSGVMHPSLDMAMKQHIEAALAATHGRVEGRYGAAALLKINPHTLRARMRKLGINWASFRLQKEE
ncbi:MAG TPA: sigma 54-interacting transcriptional regulator [Thermodesulfobacteriota bacterium]|nr:sigma 54-interacting transcriptional regulator [Thermodesulfobacteriota bacterium]